MIIRALGLLIISMSCFAIDSPTGVSTALADIRDTLQSDVRKVQAELGTLNWLHPKRIGLNRRLKELQARIEDITDQDQGLQIRE